MANEDKYHINIHGDAVKCPAKIKCTLKNENGEPQDHYDTPEEARKAHEKELAQKYKITPKSRKKYKKDNSHNITQAKKLIENLSDKEDYEPEELQEIGRLLKEDIFSRLSKNPNNIDSKEIDYNELQQSIQTTLNNITSTGKELNNTLLGNKENAKILQEASTLFPNSIKERMENKPINVESVRRNSVKHAGFFSPYRYVKQKRHEEVNKLLREYIAHKKGDYIAFQGEIPINSNEIYMQKIHYLNDDGAYQVFYITNDENFKPSRGNKNNPNFYKKFIKDKILVKTDLGNRTLNNAILFEVLENQKKYDAVTIAGMNNNGHTMSVPAIYVHEYSHMAEYYISELKFNNSIKMVQKLYDTGERGINDEGNLSPFPREYMADSHGHEFFASATESLLTPYDSDNKMYGKDKHPNADAILEWTLGIWATAGVKSEKYNKK